MPSPPPASPSESERHVPAVPEQEPRPRATRRRRGSRGSRGPTARSGCCRRTTSGRSSRRRGWPRCPPRSPSERRCAARDSRRPAEVPAPGPAGERRGRRGEDGRRGRGDGDRLRQRLACPRRRARGHRLLEPVHALVQGAELILHGEQARSSRDWRRRGLLSSAQIASTMAMRESSSSTLISARPILWCRVSRQHFRAGHRDRRPRGCIFVSCRTPRRRACF